MANNNIPFNIDLLDLTPDKLFGVRPVTSLDIFDGATKNFNQFGLYSIEIFGKIGDERRNRRFSYIDIKVSILHPIIFRALSKLKAFYIDIIKGKAYAVWNDEIKDFDKSTPMDGQTGFDFFIQNWKKIEFEKRPSVSREQYISLIEKFKDRATLTKIVVLPAGLRDFEIGGDGRQSEDEINGFYKKLLSLSNSISEAALKNNIEMLNNTRLSIQSTFNDIYDYIENMIEGKKKLMMGKWASRKVFNTTRNVITTTMPDSKELNSRSNVGVNDTIVGLYQYIKASMPISRFNLKNGFLSKVFSSPDSEVALVNKQTLSKEMVRIKPQYYDAWMTDEGLEKVMTSFKEADIRHKPLEINGYYLGLIYKGKDGTYKIIQDIGEVPPERSKDDVFPLTFCELIYLSVYKTSHDYPAYVTRYPITGFGSIYPSWVFLKPTTRCEIRKELDDNWEIMSDENTAYQFPITGESFVEAVSPSSSHLQLLGADFDGDTVSLSIVYTDEAIEEVKNYLGGRKYYINTSGKLSFSNNIDTVKFVLQNMTGP